MSVSRSWAWGMAGLLLAVLGGRPALAAEMVVLNLSPSATRYEVLSESGTRLAEAVGYLETETIDLPEGGARLRLRPDDSGPESSVFVAFDSARAERPLLIIAGEGGAQGLQILTQLHPAGELTFANNLPSPPRSNLRPPLIHLALGLDPEEPFERALTCGAVTFRTTAVIPYAGVVQDARTIIRPAGDTCTLGLRALGFGVVEVDVVEDELGMPRVFMVGNGLAWPYALVVEKGGEIAVRVESQVSPAVGPLLHSTNHWSDVNKSGQSLGIFELPGAGIVYGTWQTFREDGDPRWLLMEGVYSDVPRRRDVQFLEMLREGEEVVSQTRGSGVLTYIDCNTAELRATLAGSLQRTLRVKRSRSVSSCPEIED